MFAGVLGALLTVVLAGIALRWTRPGVATVITAVVVAAGAVATIVTVVAVTRAHPAAASDPSHAFAVLYAIALCLYVVLAAANPRAGASPLWWGLGGAAASSVVWLAMRDTSHVADLIGMRSYSAIRWHQGRGASARAERQSVTATPIRGPGRPLNDGDDSETNVCLGLR